MSRICELLTRLSIRLGAVSGLSKMRAQQSIVSFRTLASVLEVNGDSDPIKDCCAACTRFSVVLLLGIMLLVQEPISV